MANENASHSINDNNFNLSLKKSKASYTPNVSQYLQDGPSGKNHLSAAASHDNSSLLDLYNKSSADGEKHHSQLSDIMVFD